MNNPVAKTLFRYGIFIMALSAIAEIGEEVWVKGAVTRTRAKQQKEAYKHKDPNVLDAEFTSVM